MRTKPKYSFEIDCRDYECDRFEDRGMWAGYGTLVAEGDTLEELLDSAGIDICDQDGGELYCGPADENWMQELVIEAFWKAQGHTPDAGKCETHNDFVARMETLQAENNKRLIMESVVEAHNKLMKKYKGGAE